jgi:hypothetical protein
MAEDTHWGEDAQFRENSGTKSCRACGTKFSNVSGNNIGDCFR